MEQFVDYTYDEEMTDASGAVTLVDDNAVAHSTYTAKTDFPDQVVSAPVVLDVAFAVVPGEQTSFFAPTLLSPVAVPPGGRITLQGRIAPAGSTAPLRVEQRFGAGAWQLLGTVPVAADGTFTLPLGPRSQVGTWTVRATHPAEGALVAGAGEATTKVTVTGIGKRTAWHPIAGTKKAPARWGTCRIGYRVNERRMPATGMVDLREAMRRVTQVTGIRFRYRGRTSAVPQGSYGGPGLNKMVVAWAPPARSGGLLVDGVGGVGGTSRTSSRLLSGYVLMNSDYSDKAEAGIRCRPAARPRADARARARRRPRPRDRREADHGAGLAAAGRRVGRRRPQRPATRRLPLPLIDSAQPQRRSWCCQSGLGGGAVSARACSTTQAWPR